MIIARRIAALSYFRDLYKNSIHLSNMTPGPVETSLRSKLSEHLKPLHLDVVNESYMHNVPKESELHFKVIVVSDLFNGKSLLERHRMINDVLAEDLKTSVHALSIVAKTPDQWTENPEVTKSPACKGGFGK